MIVFAPKQKLPTHELVNINQFASNAYRFLQIRDELACDRETFFYMLIKHYDEVHRDLMQRRAEEFSELINSEDDGLDSKKEQDLLKQLKACRTLQQALELLGNFISEFFQENFTSKIKLNENEKRKANETEDLLGRINEGFDNQLALILALTNITAQLLKGAKFAGQKFIDIFNSNLDANLQYLHQFSPIPTTILRKLYNMLGEKAWVKTRIYKFAKKYFALDNHGFLRLKQALVNKWIKACRKDKIKFRWFDKKRKQTTFRAGLRTAQCPAYRIKTPHNNNLVNDTQLWTLRLIKKYINPLIENLEIRELKSSLTDYLLPLRTRAKVQ